MSRTITPEHKYLVHDTQKSKTGFDGGTVSFHKDLKSASRAAEKRNLEHGSHRYSARPLSKESLTQNASKLRDSEGPTSSNPAEDGIAGAKQDAHYGLDKKGYGSGHEMEHHGEGKEYGKT